MAFRPRKIAVKIGDTNYPEGPDSGGSVTTLSLTPAVRDAAWQASQKFLADIAPALGATPDDLVLVDGEVRSQSGKVRAGQLPARGGQNEHRRKSPCRPSAFPTTTRRSISPMAASMSPRSRSIPSSGRIHVRRVLSVHDCGRPMNPAQTISQINGGIIQGISYTLLENRLLDPVYGLMVNPDLEKYKIAGSREIPEIDVRLVEAYIGQSSTDASGIGEAAGVVSIGAAIGNAVYNAIGVRVRRTPMTPARGPGRAARALRRERSWHEPLLHR